VSACCKCGHDPLAVVGGRWELHIAKDPPSLNDRLHNAGASRWRYAKERAAWAWLIRQARLVSSATRATGKRRVTLTRVYAGRQKERDADNLAGGMKAIVDALVREGLLIDDAPRFAEIHHAQVRGEPTGLRIEIEELAP
jgi:Holliday junction resolvase RusA-like endonuclease